MWLYIPNHSTSSASAPEASDLITPLSWQFQVLERSAWSRGKPSRSRNWFALWKRAVWLRRLYGAMPEPSTADHGAASWMASLAASRASRTALPASSSARKTSATSGQLPAASSSSLARGSSLSRTSVGCCLRAVRNVSGETFTDWASRLREDCSRRQKSARRTSANASSSSQWPTVMAHEARLGFQGRDNPEAKGSQQSLTTIAMLWMTPRASDAEHGGPNQRDSAGNPALPSQASQWATPTSLSFGESHQPGNSRSYNINMDLAHEIYSHLDLTISTVGEAHSRPRRSLNPLFVEWLMGWPPGWTLAAWTDFACSETELCLWKALMRSALSQLGLPQEAPPQQLALFG